MAIVYSRNLLTNCSCFLRQANADVNIKLFDRFEHDATYAILDPTDSCSESLQHRQMEALKTEDIDETL